MVYRNVFFCCGMIAGLLLSACTPNNVALGPNPAETESAQNITVEVEAARDGVFTIQNGERQPLPVTERVVLAVGQAVTVDEEGRAIIHFGDSLTLELLQSGEVELKQLSVAEETTAVTVRQIGGTLVVDLTPTSEAETQLTVQTPAGTVTANNETRFALVHQTNSPLAWVLGLEGGQGALQITANDVTQSLVGGQARWITPNGEPGPVVPISQNAEAWLGVVRNSTPDTEVGEVLLPLANLLADAGSFTTLPAPGRATELIRDEGQGVITLTLDAQGIFGSPDYTLEDCNDDGVQDIGMVNGALKLDFRAMQVRVQGLDVTVLNRDEPGQGSLQMFDSAGNEIGRQQVQVGNDAVQTLSLRSNQPQHRAELVVSNACFLGLGLTPSAAPIAETRQQVTSTLPPTPENAVNTPSAGDAVVNILETSTERLLENGEFRAPFVGGDDGSLIEIDGSQVEWDVLAGQNNVAWTPFSTVTHNANCANRHPDSGDLTDLSGRVQLAYDDQYLYVAFVVNDDGLVTYTGQDERYFLGDSPQLLLDLNLNGDFDDVQLSTDDVQVDLLPSGNAPRVALWQLSTLSSSLFFEALVVTTPTDTGYFLEAALPWQELNVTPQPGDRLGIVASISDNDTPGTDAQECIISSSPQRDWRNPTTWGTVLLSPTLTGEE